MVSERARVLLGAAWLLTGLGAPVATLADPLDDVLARLDTQGPVVARFEEERHLSFLDRPLRSSGTLSFNPPDVLIKQTLVPEPGLARIEGDELTIADASGERRIPLDADPLIRAYVAPFRALLAGDRAALERHFEVATDAAPRGWSMTLTPREEAVAERLERVEVSGGDARIERIEIHEEGGDRSVLTLSEAPS